MKNNSLNFMKFVLILILAVSVSSCEWVDPDININPDTPTEVPITFILPTIQANMAYDIGGNDIVRPTNMWMQYLNGHARQSLAQARYIYTPSDVNNVWNSLYYNVLQDIRQIKISAEESNSLHFLGVARILNAITLMAIADLWGDAPWSEAIQGGAYLSPKLDSQQSIYVEAIKMLDSAVVNLQKENVGIPLNGDLIYDGNTAKWIGAARAIKARALLVQSKRNANAYSEVLAVLNQGGIESTADNMVLFFNENAGVGHPLYQFMAERGDVNMGKTFVDMLNSDQDPRRARYIAGGVYVGGDIGTEDSDGIGKPGSYAAAHNAGSWFITFAEQKFMQAEALLPTDPAEAYKAYVAGAMSSLVQAGVDTTGIKETDFYDKLTEGGEAALTLERIIRQKYIALYNTMYSYNDWRRTGYPSEINDVLPANASINTKPRRFPYGQSEITYNQNVSAVPITGRVWWDAE